jgi:hypothetical protein
MDFEFKCISLIILTLLLFTGHLIKRISLRALRLILKICDMDIIKAHYYFFHDS